MAVGYLDLPVSLRGSPGAMARFSRRRVVTIEPWAVFGFLTAAVMVQLAIGWLRRMFGMLGP